MKEKIKFWTRYMSGRVAIRFALLLIAFFILFFVTYCNPGDPAIFPLGVD